MATGSTESTLQTSARDSTLTAGDVMNPATRTCSPFSTVTEAVMIFKDVDCGMVPIVDEGRPTGVLTDRDVALALADHPDLSTQPVSRIMSTNIVSVRPDTKLDEVARVFAESEVRRLLVVDDRGLLAGIIAWKDIAPHLSYRLTGQIVSETLDEA